MATPKKRARQVVRETRKELETAPPPAYFLSLTVENVRSFGPAQPLALSTDGDRPARWTVILGDNGVGKTTLLQTLARCRGVPLHDPEDNSSGSKLWTLEAWPALFFDGVRRSASQESSGYLTARLEVSICFGRGLENSEPMLPTTDLFMSEVVGRVNGQTEWFPNVSLVENDLGGLVCYGYGAARRMGTTALSETHRLDSTASLFSDNVGLLNAEEWLLQADYAALVESPSQEQARRRRDDIRQVLIDLLPDVSDIQFMRPTSSVMTPRVVVETPYGWVRIHDLSLGYRALIAWVVDLAYRLFERYPDSPNPLAEPAIVLVDEIDLHLHPRWQRTIMAYLTERFPNTQFIVTAHSPLIVQAATDANIVLLRREGDHVVIDNDVEAIRGWRIDQVLTSDLFGLETARPPEYDEAMVERNRILGKSRLTKKDEQRLKELDAQIGHLPTGETPQDMEAMDVIRRAAEVLKRERADLR